MNPNYNNQYNNFSKNDDRFFFAAPFLFGALAGGAIASTAGPRPVFVSSPPQMQQPMYNQNQSYPGAYGSANYSYYYPMHTRNFKKN